MSLYPITIKNANFPVKVVEEALETMALAKPASGGGGSGGAAAKFRKKEKKKKKNKKAF